MRPTTFTRGWACALGVLLLAGTVFATDVDGPNDCTRSTRDFGDAPEGFDAYPGIVGRFPTCMAPSAAGTQTGACPPISTPPGLTGFVVHVNPDPDAGYWLGCGPAGGPPLGIDSEVDGKVSPGAPFSNCSPNLMVDCVEPTPIGPFGQDECVGGDDAGLLSAAEFATCTPSTVTFEIQNCSGPREVRLNILIDMNQDGDWNDNFECPSGCVYEWAVQNAL